MIESPLVQEWQANYGQNMILKLLKKRFGKIPQDVRKLLIETKNTKRLTDLNCVAAECKSINDFRDRLLT